jgi:hypothetical protein
MAARSDGAGRGGAPDLAVRFLIWQVTCTTRLVLERGRCSADPTGGGGKVNDIGTCGGAAPPHDVAAYVEAQVGAQTVE